MVFKNFKPMIKIISKLINIFLTIVLLFLVFSCGIYKKVDTRQVPVSAEERARKNIQEGKGISLKNVLGNRSTNYEFSTSNPMWRATLDTLDFIPLTTVDYSGGVLITEWYSVASSDRESIKITIRFLSNEVRSDSLKIVVHKKTCDKQNLCKTDIVDSKIKEELIAQILSKATFLEKQKKN